MNKFQIAIVGAGPAGYFAAQALQNLETEDLKFAIDMFEKLPTPWGLVRSGVAPDHPKIKSVSKVFEKIATTEGFRLFANVELGKDLELVELTNHYDAVVLAVGSSKGKKLGIPGEDLPGSLSAAQFVPWYNGHPDFAQLNMPLDCETAVVIGAGNVAMDVARMLALDPTELDPTDTADPALAQLHKSNIRQVHLCARRGPEHVAFTSPELRELPKLEHTTVIINETEITQALERLFALPAPDSDAKNNLEAMLVIATEQKPKQARTLDFHFLLTPKEIRGSDRVEEIVFTVNEVHADSVVPTEETYSIRCGLVVSAIGYETELPLELELEKGHLKNQSGLIKDNLYVVGWAKRGPSGVIGTNKSDSTETMKYLVGQLNNQKNSGDFAELLETKRINYLTQKDWENINEFEVRAGELKGKPRVKIVDRDKFLKLKSD
jgi:ferredoxin--NADP+ reductase